MKSEVAIDGRIKLSKVFNQVEICNETTATISVSQAGEALKITVVNENRDNSAEAGVSRSDLFIVKIFQNGKCINTLEHVNKCTCGHSI